MMLSLSELLIEWSKFVIGFVDLYITSGYILSYIKVAPSQEDCYGCSQPVFPIAFNNYFSFVVVSLDPMWVFFAFKSPPRYLMKPIYLFSLLGIFMEGMFLLQRASNF